MKDSGVKWLGEIPAHWKTASLKYLFKIVSGSTPKSSEPDYWNGDLPWITPKDLGEMDGCNIVSAKRNITLNGYLNCATNMVPVGSIIISTRAPIGYVGIAQVELCTNQGCRSLIPQEDFNSKFYYYFLSVASQELQSLGQGSTFYELSTNDLGSMILPYTSREEQNAICSLVDAEMRVISLIMEKTKRAIKLLKEYRTALISAAVTGKIDLREEVSCHDCGSP